MEPRAPDFQLPFYFISIGFGQEKSFRPDFEDHGAWPGEAGRGSRKCPLPLGQPRGITGGSISAPKHGKCGLPLVPSDSLLTESEAMAIPPLTTEGLLCSKAGAVLGSWAQAGPWHRPGPDAPGLCAQQAPACPCMETFFRRHFQRKAPGPGEGQRPNGMGLPTGKARRRSPAGQASSSLAQRRRSSAQPQGCFLGCGLRASGTSRRRSSTAPPARNPRFVVSKAPASQPAAVGAQLLGAPLLLAGLVGMSEEKQEEGVQEEDVPAAALSTTQRDTKRPGPSPRQSAGTLLPASRCLRGRRTSSHLLPADAVYDRALWGLHGCYRRLSQQRPSGQQPGPGGRKALGATASPAMPARVRPLSRRRQVALRRKSAGPQAWSALLA